jgi:hypothetical protein
VQDLVLMREQNELIRRHARGPFGELLAAVVKHPAMLVWLDADSNRPGHPNENLARELVELFTLGIGHFDETDVKEAARALTGWSLGGKQLRFVDQRHWLGRAMDRRVGAAASGEASRIFVGDEQTPLALWARRAAASSLARLDDLTLRGPAALVGVSRDANASSANDAGVLPQFVIRQVLTAYAAASDLEGQRRSGATRTPVDYPDSPLASHLQVIVQLLQSGARALHAPLRLR